MWSVVVETGRVLNESAVYLLLGFALAGVLHVVLSRYQWLSRLLAGRGSKSVVLAALLGAPLPLCSCSVLPAGLTLYRKGASKGATASFLISVPETDIVSILLTYGLLGPVMAVFRPLAAIATALVTGSLINLTDRLGASVADAPADDDESCGDTCRDEGEEYVPRKGALWNAAHYGFVKFFDDIIVSLLMGIVLGGAITALLPSMGIERLAGNSWLTMLAMLVIGIPMYVCATSSTPIAAGLMIGGISPGAALVFLLAGPATNMASLIVLNKYLGRGSLVVYLLCIAAVSLLMGVWLDSMMAGTSVGAMWSAPSVAESSLGAVKTGGAAIMAVLSILSLRRVRVFSQAVDRLNRFTGLSMSPGTVKAVLAVLAIVAYLGSGLFTVSAGERAVVTTFGRITESDLEPGLHYRWPYPVGRADCIPVERVRRIELGFRKEDRFDSIAEMAVAADRYIGESWMLTGNEDIISVKWVVQYRVADTEAGLLDYVYGVAAPDLLVRNAAESAIRQEIGQRNIDTLLTTDRDDVETRVADRLQALLTTWRAGVRIASVHLKDVHAPPEVHAAFRDVASAAEDKQRAMNIAYEYDERIVHEARGDVARQLASARAQAARLVDLAAGESNAFADRLAAYRVGPAITRLRLYFESVDAWLPRVTKYVNLAEGRGAELEIWQTNGQAAPPTIVPPIPLEVVP